MALFPQVSAGDRIQVEMYYPATQARRLGHSVQSYGKRIRPRWAFHLGWNLLEAAEQQQIEAHEDSVGRLPFDWYDWRPRVWRYLTLGTGDGVEDTFDVPGTGTSAQTFYVNGVSAAATVSAGAGLDGRDRVTFTAVPADGARISASFTGVRLVRAVLRADIQYRGLAEPLGCYQAAASLYEVP